MSLARLGLDAEEVAGWFTADAVDEYTLTRMSAEDAEALADRLSTALRRCFLGDEALEARSRATGYPRADLIAARLPDPGSTMSGDFGEILAYTYIAAARHPDVLDGPFKWRLKEDRTRSAPYSDIVLYHLPHWPTASDSDGIVCAEVKTKATHGASNPIAAAIRDSGKDRVSRLAKTLQWLRERALIEDIEGATIDILDRFAHATEYPPATREFHAVAVVSGDLVADELGNVPAIIPPEPHLTILVVPNLRATYSAVFEAAANDGM